MGKKLKAFRIDREIKNASGYQSYGVIASDINEAFEKFRDGEDIYLEEKCEITSLGELKLDGIYEIEPSDCVKGDTDEPVWPNDIKNECQLIESSLNVDFVYSLEFMFSVVLPKILSKGDHYDTYQIYNDEGLHGFSFIVSGHFEKVELYRCAERDLKKAMVRSICLCLDDLKNRSGF